MHGHLNVKYICLLHQKGLYINVLHVVDDLSVWRFLQC